MAAKLNTGGTAMKKVFRFMGHATAAIAAMVVLAVAGLGTEAQALQFGAGDMVLAIYGNDTEYVQKIGTISSLTAPNASLSLDLSGIMSQVGGGNTIQYTLVGFDGPDNLTSTSFMAGSSKPAEQWTQTQKNQIVPTNYLHPLINWGQQLGAAADARTLIAKSDALSFSSNLDTTGAHRLLGFPIAMTASVDTILSMIQRPTVGTGVALSNIGSALLTAGGIFTIGNPGPIAAVPVPAAAVLFATGMIGLIGMARRSLGLS
jgi:hypothetical protein